jgi:hypothetical protein
MTLCDQVIVDHRTEKPSLIGVFSGLPVTGFPSDPERFSVFPAITDGHGAGLIEVVVKKLATDAVIFSRAFAVRFPNRLTVVHAHFRIRTIRFPAAGLYASELHIDGEPIAQYRFRVYESKDEDEK